jgi:two-component system, chemotaxis family, protein-glutamate methylesterase/glutaminase
VTRILLIGASAGGIEPLMTLTQRLPADLPAPALIVVHIPPDVESRLPEILQRRCVLPVRHARDAEPLHEGHVFVAPPDRHLMVENGRVRVVRGPRQNRHRPAIDTLLRTAAVAHGPDVVAVILSGAPGDAVAGASIVARRGGRVIVQDPAEAVFDGMPKAVLGAVADAVVLPTSSIPDAIQAAFHERSVMTSRERGHQTGKEAATMDQSTMSPIDPGRPSYSCPDCGGVLEEILDDGPLHFECRVGHVFYDHELASAQWGTLEDALWSAIRGMEENAELSARLARMAEERGARSTAERHRDRGTELLAQSRVIRGFLLGASPADDGGETSEKRVEAAR